MVWRPAIPLRYGMAKAQLAKIERVDERIAHADRAFFADVFIQAFGEENALIAIGALDVVHASPQAIASCHPALLWHQVSFVHSLGMDGSGYATGFRCSEP